jgi:hypothetical protein
MDMSRISSSFDAIKRHTSLHEKESSGDATRDWTSSGAEKWQIFDPFGHFDSPSIPNSGTGGFASSGRPDFTLSVATGAILG